MNDPVYRNLKDAEVVQELTFQRENDATHKVEGVSNYLTKEAQERLNTSNVFQYDSNKLQASDIVSNSPWTNTEDEWIQVKEGDKFVVTYDGLNQSSMLVENVLYTVTKSLAFHQTTEKVSRKSVRIQQ